jgi:hypothetical protein
MGTESGTATEVFTLDAGSPTASTAVLYDAGERLVAEDTVLCARYFRRMDTVAEGGKSVALHATANPAAWEEKLVERSMTHVSTAPGEVTERAGPVEVGAVLTSVRKLEDPVTVLSAVDVRRNQKGMASEPPSVEAAEGRRAL